jgi:uncharacterized LabA/DUF88 family protein
MSFLMNRLSIFVDGNNMFYAQQKNGWFFDPRRVLEYFKKEQMGALLVNAFWYTGLKDPQDQRGFRDALISLGYTVRTKILKEYYDDTSGRYSQKANLDIEIVIDMFNTVEHMTVSFYLVVMETLKEQSNYYAQKVHILQ